MRKIIKKVIPPIITDYLKAIKFPWKGEFSSWSEAMHLCSGYDSDLIADKILKSALKVHAGTFPYERDSVLFDVVQYSWPLSTVILHCANKFGKLRVLDFGGGLGSSYFQNLFFIDPINDVKWYIVEQGKLIERSAPLSSERLIFKNDLNEVVKESEVNLVIFSSVLQYIEKPSVVIDEVLKLKPDLILIDRVSIVKNEKDVLTIQSVEDSIYEASYPCWFFNERSLLEKFENYSVVSKFDSYVKNEGILNHKYEVQEMGYFLSRKKNF